MRIEIAVKIAVVGREDIDWSSRDANVLGRVGVARPGIEADAGEDCDVVAIHQVHAASRGNGGKGGRVPIAPAGRVHLVDGDDVEILPGIRVYTGARHTYASQYVRVAGTPTYVLASDNCYLYRNLDTHAASATFSEADRPANIKAQERMVQLAGAKERVVPGHDALQFERFPTTGRIAKIK